MSFFITPAPAASGWEKIDFLVPTAVSVITWTDLAAYKSLRFSGLMEGASIPTSMQFDVRVGAGTWRKVQVNNGIGGGNYGITFSGYIENFDAADGDFCYSLLDISEDNRDLLASGDTINDASAREIGTIHHYGDGAFDQARIVINGGTFANGEGWIKFEGLPI